jgi:hypothetical protein
MPEKSVCPNCKTEQYARFLGTSRFLFEDPNYTIFHTKKRCQEQQNESTLEQRFVRIETDVEKIKERLGL